MFPPLEPSQVPDIWFCPVCVARNWHVPPPDAIQTPPTTLPSTSVSSTPLPLIDSNLDIAKQQDQISPPTDVSTDRQDQKSGSGATNNNPNDTEDINRRWREAQRWKENSRYSPLGYLLDPQCAERFIPLSGDGPVISLSSVMKNRSTDSSSHAKSNNETSKSVSNEQSDGTTSSVPTTAKVKPYRAGKSAGGRNKSPPRKRSKYSNLPSEVETAFDLIKSHLENASNGRKSQDDVENKAKTLEQKLKIQEGEMLISRQELQSVKQKLSVELSNAEQLKMENTTLRKEVQELQELVQKKENQIKSWQNMLRTMIGTGGEVSMNEI
ncbi:hypothetical protein B7463_g6940, partial [Scytalidium lignicola]